MATVIFKKATYEEKVVRPIIFSMIETTGSIDIHKDSKVLIKPNLLLPAKPEKAILTHPILVKAVTDYVLECGGRPIIADSPAMGSLEKILKEGGYAEIFKDSNVEFKRFETSSEIDVGTPFGNIEIAKEAIETDIVINLAKLKTHTQMLLTLGVKNLFGCIVGLKKPEWHLRSGIDRDMFATLLVKICAAVNPSYTIIDGVLSLEGQGPGKSGTPTKLGVIAGSKNVYAIDRAICQMINVDPEKLPTNMAAKQLGVFTDDVRVEGDFEVIRDFLLPDLGKVMFGPKPAQRLIRKHMLQRPVANHDQCELCSECWRYCPAKAIFPRKKRIVFDYDKCIRCYCCLEVCPHGALFAKETLPGKVIRRFSLGN
jgi:uncharacterized protein (DUF362 family)/Pyruvate/2-oxoacid:ferredoxin oxidoreductase delta subunit